MATLDEFRAAKRAASQKYREANREKVNAASRQANALRRQDPVLRAKANASSVKSITKRRAEDPLFKFQESVKSLLLACLANRGWSKQTRTQQLLGCTFEELQAHLARQFKPGMSWDNHGAWHIDHRRPLATARNQEELEALFHFSNLQPLWAAENIKKGSKI
jgi:uncharacterized Zn finger protein